MSVVCGTSTGFDDTAAGSRPVSALSDSGRATPALVAASRTLSNRVRAVTSRADRSGPAPVDARQTPRLRATTSAPHRPHDVARRAHAHVAPSTLARVLPSPVESRPAVARLPDRRDPASVHRHTRRLPHRGRRVPMRREPRRDGQRSAGPDVRAVHVAPPRNQDDPTNSCCSLLGGKPVPVWVGGGGGGGPLALGGRISSRSAKRSCGAFARARRTMPSRSGGKSGHTSAKRSRGFVRQAMQEAIVHRAGKRLVGEQLVGNSADREDVAAKVDRPAKHLLRRHVVERADQQPSTSCPNSPRGDAEVEDLDAVRVDHHVRRLDVAVDDAGAVRMMEPGADLLDEPTASVPTGSGCRRLIDFRQRRAVHVLHGDERLVVVLPTS